VPQRRVTVASRIGLHARPARLLVEEAARLPVRVTIAKDGGRPADARSILSVLALNARGGDTVVLAADGEGAEQAVEALAAFLAVDHDAGQGRAGVSTTHAGIGVSPGVAVGPVVRLVGPPELPATAPAVADTEAEMARAVAALQAVAADLDRRCAAAVAEAAEALAATAMIARDPVLAYSVAVLVRAGRAAPWAVRDAIESFRAKLVAKGGYLAERAADLDDVRARAVAVLLGVPMPSPPRPGYPHVLIAGNLAPADTATLDPNSVLALVTVGGGPFGHTAILAKSLGIPAVVACTGAAGLTDGEVVAVDGGSGVVTVAPDPADVSRVRSRAAAMASMAAMAARTAASHGPGRTADGHPIKLLLNVGGADLDSAGRRGDSEGIGLLRTEFLFLHRQTAPTLAEQEAAYREVFERFPGRQVVVRTLDAGVDKPLPFASLGAQPNPALGVRGVRTFWRYPELLETQLEAIARAGKDGPARVWVMAPMVATVEEAAAFAGLARAHGHGTVGVMVEVPSAALGAESILDVVDFVSIGTNDLTQYTLAADRQVGALARLLDPWQPALLRLIAMTAAAGASAGKPVGVCGEAAGDPLLAAVLVGLGVTSLSMAAADLPAVQAALAERTLEQCRSSARRALAAPTAEAARSAAGTARTEQ